MGIVLIYSATYKGGLSREVLVQSGAVLVGLVMLIIISNIDYEIYYDLAKFIFPVCVIGLVVTYFVAKPINGNKNWIDFGILNLQTSEITKIGFILTLSAHVKYVKDEINLPKNVLLLFLHLCAYAAPIALQNDWGSILVYIFMFIVILFVGGLSLKYFIGGIIMTCAMTPIIWTYFLSANRKKRILVVFNPDLDPQNAGFHQIQSRMTIGSGKLWGSGLLKGIQTHYGSLPEKQTDFIFAVAGEELGLVGLLVIMILLIILMIRIIRLVFVSRDEYGAYICAGVFSMILFQSIINIGMCVGLLPVIGITLPLFSYGGSSILSLYISLGLVAAVKIRSHTLDFKYD